jgi:single-strand DNA-binding protein
MYINKAFVGGNLTRDPEMKALPSGAKVTTFSVATNRVWKDQSGMRQEATEYHNVVVFGRQAETCSQFLRKGSNCFIEGRIQTRSWDGPDGQKRYRTEVVADRVQFGARPTGNGGSAVSAPEMIEDASDTIEYPTDDINPDDIPF